MRHELEAFASTARQKAYLEEIDRRTRRGAWAMRARYVAIHASWIVVLLAGAAVALVDVFDLSTRFAAVLGFVIVVFQGIERIFERTSQGAAANDVLRRALEREGRLLLVGGGAYADAADETAALDVFAVHCEDLLARNDAVMIDYFAALARSIDKS